MGIDAKVTVPDRFIEDMVKAEIVTKLTENPNFVSKFLESALSMKAQYGNQTVFGKMVKAMIEEAGKEVFGEWLDQNKDLIKKGLFIYLNKNKQKVLKDLVEKMAGTMNSFYLSVHMNLKDD